MRLALAGTHIVPDLARDHPMQYNVAIGCLAAYARKMLPALETALVDFPITLDEPSLPRGAAERILASDPEVVGLSSYCWDADAWRTVIPRLKRLSPSVRLVLGGPTATFGARELMRELPQLDAAVRGEGEGALVELLEKGVARAREVPGVCARDGDGPPRSPIESLAELPSPFVTETLRPNKMNLMTSYARGCVYRCRHCAWKHISGGMRYQSGGYIEEELAWAAARGFRHAFVFDSAINYSDARLEEVAAAVSRAIPRREMEFTFFVDHARVNPAQARALRRIPAQQVFIGLETLGREAARALGRRPVDRKAFERALALVCESAPAVLCAIVGIPGDTLRGFLETVDYAVALARDRRFRVPGIRVFWDVVTPGSLLDSRREEYGIRIAERGMPYMLSCDSFPEADMIEALRALRRHPGRDLLIFEDADPSRLYRGFAA